MVNYWLMVHRYWFMVGWLWLVVDSVDAKDVFKAGSMVRFFVTRGRIIIHLNWMVGWFWGLMVGWLWGLVIGWLRGFVVCWLWWLHIVVHRMGKMVAMFHHVCHMWIFLHVI